MRCGHQYAQRAGDARCRTAARHPDDHLCNRRRPQYDGLMAGPPKHGAISVSEMPRATAKKHLSELTKHAAIVRQYNGHGGGPETNIRLPNTGESSQGGFAAGGASGSADYQTTNVGSDCGDADSGGPSL